LGGGKGSLGSKWFCGTWPKEKSSNAKKPGATRKLSQIEPAARPPGGVGSHQKRREGYKEQKKKNRAGHLESKKKRSIGWSGGKPKDLNLLGEDKGISVNPSFPARGGEKSIRPSVKVRKEQDLRPLP